MKNGPPAAVCLLKGSHDHHVCVCADNSCMEEEEEEEKPARARTEPTKMTILGERLLDQVCCVCVSDKRRGFVVDPCSFIAHQSSHYN